jgi:hypothetical protein
MHVLNHPLTCIAKRLSCLSAGSRADPRSSWCACQLLWMREQTDDVRE